MDTSHRPAARWPALGLRVAGGGLLIATAAIHLDLYLTGYRTIPAIGWLFLLQVITAFVLGAAVLALGSRLAAAAGAGFELATLGGYLLSIWIGLFGFREVRTTAGIVAGVIEVVAFALLAALALAPGRPAARPDPFRMRPVTGRLQAGVTKDRAVAAVSAVSAVALVLLGVAVAGAGGQPAAAAPAGTAASGAVLKTARINGVTVVTSPKGFTLYSFAPDTATRSACSGTCAQYWPPVLGTPAAAPGVTGTLGTIKRPDGGTQAVYDGHPLYTYVGDSGPGQANGNNLNLNGGLWHEVSASG
jgi:predicted lipoprotein with Yx(FWY)xxD motif